VSAVGDGRLADALLAANGADGALDAVLREFGVEPPAVAARRNAAWVELFQAVARTAPGAVALAMLLATPEVSPAQLLADWQAAPRPAAIRLCAGAGPALTRAALASLVGIPDTHAGEGTVDAASVEGTLVGWARARFGDEFDALLRTLRRPLRLLGKSFVSEAAALAALEGRRAELNAAGGTSTEAVLDDPGDAPASGGGGGGGGARFSARASVVGREGERYLRERLLAGALPPGVAGADEVRVFDVSTADRAREACANPLVRDWLGDAQVSDHPGFDLLLAMRHADAWTWEGIEVKSTVDPLDGELCFDFTENELRTARGLQPEGGWPVARYRIACVTRLWSVDATGALLAPQLTWLTDPAALIEQNRVRLDTEERRTVRQRLTARVRTRG
jgi:hypothetical protein